jgi:hypothetical protein
VLGGGAVACVSPRMPSLKLRTPSPRPFMTSGIFLPPNKIMITAAMINRCIGDRDSIRLLRALPTPSHTTGQNDLATTGKLDYNTISPVRRTILRSIAVQGTSSQRCRHFFHDGAGRSYGIGCGSYRPSDHQVVSSGTDRRGGSRGAGLVVLPA